MRIVSFGTVTLPEMNGLQQLPVSFRSSVVALRGGGFDQDGSKSYLESKMVTAQFWVTPDDGTVDTIIDNIYQQAGKGRQLLVASMRDGTASQRQQFAKLISATTKPDSRYYMETTAAGEGYETFQLQWELVYPYWESTDDSPIYFDSGEVFGDGLFFDAGNYSTLTLTSTPTEVPTTTSKTINNAGNARTQKVDISIVGLSSFTDLENVTITNVTTGETLTWTGEISLDDFLEIKSLEQTIKFNGVNAWENTTLGANQVGFFTLELGDNDFEIYVTHITGGNATVRWDWAKHYIR